MKKASRLEEMAGEERRQWNQLKEDMERRIDALTNSRSRRTGNTEGTEASSPRGIIDVDTDAPAAASPVEQSFKMEPLSDAPVPGPPTSTSQHQPSPSNIQHESAADLEEEIRRLRERCAEVESALQAIRDDGSSIDGLIRSLLERAEGTLR